MVAGNDKSTGGLSTGERIERTEKALEGLESDMHTRFEGVWKKIGAMDVRQAEVGVKLALIAAGAAAATSAVFSFICGLALWYLTKQ